MITGAWRGELVTLRWRDLDLDTRALVIRRSYVDSVEKDTKTHQIRRLALDQTTVELLTAHLERYEARISSAGSPMTRRLCIRTSLTTLAAAVPTV